MWCASGGPMVALWCGAGGGMSHVPGVPPRLRAAVSPTDAGSPAAQTTSFGFPPPACRFCGQPFSPKRSNGRPQIHCTPLCRRLAGYAAALTRAGYHVTRA